MITFSNIKRYFSSPVDTGPWTYLFYDANNTGCVTFSNGNGTTSSNHVTTNVSFTNSLCISEADIRLRVQGVNGCVNTALLTFEDVCTDFVVSDISYTAPFNFAISATGGTAPYIYEWFYDEDLFEPINSDLNNPAISFSLVSGASTPSSTNVVCKVTDYNGCTDTSSYVFTFCTPSASSATVGLNCLGTDGSAYNALVFMNVTACTGIDIDWSTPPSFTSVPTGMTITHPYSAGNTNAPVNRLIVSTTNAVAPGNYAVTYKVKDENGTWSSAGTLTFVVPTCAEGVVVTPISIQNQIIKIDCSVVPGDVVEIDISDAVVPNTNVDWTSLKFTDTGTDQSATTLGEANGYDDVGTPNVTYSSANKKIYYEVPVIVGTDSFEWSISTNTTPALVSNGAIYTIILECTDAPIANDDTACVICGQTVDIDILVNDDANGGVLNTNSVILTSGPSNGTAILGTDGVISYTANTGYTGTDEITYTVNNNDNTPQTSNEATVTITIICAGEPTNVSVCN